MQTSHGWCCKCFYIKCAQNCLNLLNPFEDAAHNDLKTSVDIYGAGWPCQPFSSMGKNKGVAPHMQNNTNLMVSNWFELRKFVTSFICFHVFWLLFNSDWFLKADARSAVLEDILFYIEKYHPRSFVLENVKHVLTSSKHRLNVLKPALRRWMKHDLFHWCLLMLSYFYHNHHITKIHKISKIILT